jgi:hypothetical protein
VLDPVGVGGADQAFHADQQVGDSPVERLARARRRDEFRVADPAHDLGGREIGLRGQEQVGAALERVGGLQLVEGHQRVEGDVGEPGRHAERGQGPHRQQVLLAGGVLREPVQDAVDAGLDAEQHLSQAPGDQLPPHLGAFDVPATVLVGVDDLVDAAARLPAEARSVQQTGQV